MYKLMGKEARMKNEGILLAAVFFVCFAITNLFAAPVGNPLKEPAKGDLMIGYEETLIVDKDLKHSYYSEKQGYKANIHLAKFTYGLLDGFRVNGEIGVGRLKNVSQHVPHGNEVAWGGGANWNLLEGMHSVWPGIPDKLPLDLECGFSGRYIAIASNGDNPTPSDLSTGNYIYNENWKEYQAAAWIARNFGILIPYAGFSLSWATVRQQEDPNTGIISRRELRDASDPGFFIGCDVSFGKAENLSNVRFLKDLNLSFEYRGASESALTAGINWVWKY
jgi:hypothetical protein